MAFGWLDTIGNSASSAANTVSNWFSSDSQGASNTPAVSGTGFLNVPNWSQLPQKTAEIESSGMPQSFTEVQPKQQAYKSDDDDSKFWDDKTKGAFGRAIGNLGQSMMQQPQMQARLGAAAPFSSGQANSPLTAIYAAQMPQNLINYASMLRNQ